MKNYLVCSAGQSFEVKGTAINTKKIDGIPMFVLTNETDVLVGQFPVATSGWVESDSVVPPTIPPIPI
jgi:hypothetical protein